MTEETGARCGRARAAPAPAIGRGREGGAPPREAPRRDDRPRTGAGGSERPASHPRGGRGGGAPEGGGVRSDVADRAGLATGRRAARPPAPVTPATRRVMIVGGPGSGKSTLARRLGAITGLPVHHVDRIHWLPGWVERARDEKVAMARAVEAGERWVFEGGLSATYATRAARADAVVWLDLPVALRLWRVVRRGVVGRGRTRPDLTPGCPEQVDPAFLAYIVRTCARARRRNAALAGAVPEGAFVRLASPRAVAGFLRGVERAFA